MIIITVIGMAIGFVSLFSPAASAGFFGPSNYEECILENMKGINNEVAAFSVRNACEKKFPTASRQPDKYRIDASRGPHDRELVNKLEVLRGYSGGFQIMNRNSFAITGILVGELAKVVKNCPASDKDFEAIHWCYGLVGANQTGRVTCTDSIGTYCITGFVTDSLKDPEKFLKDNGF